MEKPPFEAYSVGCGITFTFGGLKIDTVGHVLDIEDTPIPGLYAAGELVGGLFYFNYPGSAGLMAGAVFGRIAGRGAGEFARKRLNALRHFQPDPLDQFDPALQARLTRCWPNASGVDGVGCGAFAGHERLDFRSRQDAVELDVERVDDVARRAGRNDDAPPLLELVGRHAGFSECRQIGNHARSLRCR